MTQSETWLPIPGYENLYEVSNCGRVRKVGRFKLDFLMSLSKNRGGYLKVPLTKDHRSRTHRVHSLVLAAFDREKPPGCVCRHLDGNRLNNHISNLRWGTQAENVADSILHGTRNTERSMKLLRNDVLEVRRLLEMGRTNASIAKQFNVSATTISRVKNGELHRNVTSSTLTQ
jgi:uncharacterized protein YerC